MKRLALYVFWEKTGNVRDYVWYYLSGLKEVAQDIIVIVNGSLSEEGKKRFETLGVDFFTRENFGIDFAAWKAGIEHTGWDILRQYDELILCNCSCYGPVYPFSEMFGRMEQSGGDFWGVNRQPDLPNKLIGPSGGRFPLKGHIQSYFYVFRRDVFISSAFQDWWRDLIPAKSYWDEVRFHELEFTGYLEKHGFVGKAYMDFNKYNTLAPESDACNLCADRQLMEDHNPLVKRKLFLRNSPVTLRVLRFLENHTDYPVSFILSDLATLIPHSLLSLIKYVVLSHICFGRRKIHYTVKAEKAKILRNHCHRYIG